MKKFFEAFWPLSHPLSSKPIPPAADWRESERAKNPTSSNAVPAESPLPTLPGEIHLHILEYTDWRDHPNLSLVCKLWRHFLKTSPIILKSHYENYNPFYEETWRSSHLRRRPRPHLHKVVEHLETFVRGRNGAFRPGKIQLKDPRDRWGGYWDFSKGASRGKWINPKCRPVKPFSYGLFKDDPIVRYSKGEGDKVEIRAIETSYSSRDGHRVNGRVFKFNADMTVGEYIRELIAVINYEESSVKHQRSVENGEIGSNVVWVSVYATLLKTVGLRFVMKGMYYEVERG